MQLPYVLEVTYNINLAGKPITNEPIIKDETVKQFDLSYIKSGILY